MIDRILEEARRYEEDLFILAEDDSLGRAMQDLFDLDCRIQGLVDKLPERPRQALLMRHRGCTYREVGEELGVSVERVRQLVNQGWRRVEEQLLPRGDYFDPERRAARATLDTFAHDAGWWQKRKLEVS